MLGWAVTQDSWLLLLALGGNVERAQSGSQDLWVQLPPLGGEWPANKESAFLGFSPGSADLGLSDTGTVPITCPHKEC